MYGVNKCYHVCIVRVSRKQTTVVWLCASKRYFSRPRRIVVYPVFVRLSICYQLHITLEWYSVERITLPRPLIPQNCYCQAKAEHVCVRISTGQFAAIIMVVYRPGSSAVQMTFFDELPSALVVVATFQEAVYVVGDFNIRLNREDDPNTTSLLSYSPAMGFPFTRLHPLTTLVASTLSSRVAMSLIRRTTAKFMFL